MFDITKDIAIEQAGGFFCEACLTGKPANEQSEDKRYCRGCYNFLLDEAALLPTTRGKPGWVPSQSHYAPLSDKREVVTKLHTKGIAPVDNSHDGVMAQKHAGGRPIKQGKVSKRTEYRRLKQGVLC